MFLPVGALRASWSKVMISPGLNICETCINKTKCDITRVDTSLQIRLKARSDLPVQDSTDEVALDSSPTNIDSIYPREAGKYQN